MTKNLKALKAFVYIFSALVIAGVLFLFAVMAAGGLYVRPTYLVPWEKDNYVYQTDDRLKLVSHGLLAPNSYNLQPWLVKLSDNPNEFMVYVNVERLNLLSDPKAREALISIGAFLEYINVSGNQLGIIPTIELFPNGQLNEDNLLSSLQNLPVAKVSIVTGDRVITDLYDNIFKPATNRGEYKNDVITENQISQIQSTNQNNNVKINFYSDKQDLDNFKDYLIEAVKTEAIDPEIVKGYKLLFKANEYEKNTKPYGLYFGSQDGGKVMRSLKQGAITLFPSLLNNKMVSQTIIKQTEGATKSLYNVGLIVTNNNSREQQIEAGRAYAKVALKSHNLGLSIYPISRTVQDYEPTLDIVDKQNEKYASGEERIQMLFKIGKPTIKPNKSMRFNTNQIVMSD